MDIATATLLFTIAATLISGYALLVAYYTKRQYKVYDDSAKESAQNKADIEVIKVRLNRLEEDVVKSDDRFEEMKVFIAGQIEGLSKEIKELGKIVTEIRVNCAAVGHAEALKQKVEIKL